jgi:hypothetical protein
VRDATVPHQQPAELLLQGSAVLGHQLQPEGPDDRRQWGGGGMALISRDEAAMRFFDQVQDEAIDRAYAEIAGDE